MGIAAGMKDITQEIASSYNARVGEVGRLKKEAKEMLESFRASQKEMGTQLRKDLAQDNAKVKSEVKAMRKDLAGHTQGVKGEVAKMRGKLRASQKEMGTQLRKDLAQDNAKVKSEVKAIRKELTQGVAVRKSEVKDMLGNFQRSCKQASAQLQRELADYDRGIKSEVAGMRQETKADLEEARIAWQKLTRGVKKALVKATPKVVRAEVEKAAPVEKETPDLEAKLLEAIREHPEGITLTEVSESLGVAPIVFGRAARKLLEEGRVRKEDKAYFLARAE